MTKQEIEIEICSLQEALVDCELTIADKVAIRSEIGQLQDELLRLDHQDGLVD
jgi:hypothetical protein|tara:strand:+ start:443 stop:601 length:159 start_codon:yes stop_codon:yes gene_type:complete